MAGSWLKTERTKYSTYKIEKASQTCRRRTVLLMIDIRYECVQSSTPDVARGDVNF